MYETRHYATRQERRMAADRARRASDEARPAADETPTVMVRCEDLVAGKARVNRLAPPDDDTVKE